MNKEEQLTIDSDRGYYTLVPGGRYLLEGANHNMFSATVIELAEIGVHLRYDSGCSNWIKKSSFCEGRYMVHQQLAPEKSLPIQPRLSTPNLNEPPQ